ncbi:hypothetical protein Franean1_0048 [Parafrankia sp. EAN1pec]|nr:hypothetical protein Franean1_0048 [Frankia sp. EAN1pec]
MPTRAVEATSKTPKFRRGPPVAHCSRLSRIQGRSRSSEPGPPDSQRIRSSSSPADVLRRHRRRGTAA